MNEVEKNAELRKEIVDIVYYEDYPLFIINEVENILNLMNYYRLVNIKNNINSFLENLEKVKDNYKRNFIYMYKNKIQDGGDS